MGLLRNTVESHEVDCCIDGLDGDVLTAYTNTEGTYTRTGHTHKGTYTRREHTHETVYYKFIGPRVGTWNGKRLGKTVILISITDNRAAEENLNRFLEPILLLDNAG